MNIYLCILTIKTRCVRCIPVYISCIYLHIHIHTIHISLNIYIYVYLQIKVDVYITHHIYIHTVSWPAEGHGPQEPAPELPARGGRGSCSPREGGVVAAGGDIGGDKGDPGAQPL